MRTAADLYVTVGRGQLANLHTVATVKEPLIAPLAAGAAIGEFTVTAPGGDVVIRSPLVALGSDPLGGLWTRMIDSIALWFKSPNAPRESRLGRAAAYLLFERRIPAL